MPIHRALMMTTLLAACTPETDLQQNPPTVPAAVAADASVAGADPLAAQLVDPAPGAAAIPTNLAALVLRFTEPVTPSGTAPPFLLSAPDGTELALAIGAPVACAQTCYRVPVPVELVPLTRYGVASRAGALQFLDGKPVPAGDAGFFTTGDAADRFAARIEAVSAATAEGCLSVHVVADEPIAAEVVVSAGADSAVLTQQGFAATLDFAQRLPAFPRGNAQVLVRVLDRAGNVGQADPLSVSLPSPVPRLVISEVLANPAGSETTQEWVELYNAGDATVDLGGFIIADKTGSDVLPAATLLPGTFALVVGEKYDPTAAGDVPPKEGAVLVKVAGRIGSDGLSNAGETVRLLTSAGDVVSQYGGWVDVSASAWSGKTVMRIPVDACDAPSAWSTAPAAATPGW